MRTSSYSKRFQHLGPHPLIHQRGVHWQLQSQHYNNVMLILHNIWELEENVWILKETAIMERSDVSGGRVMQSFSIEGSDTNARAIRVELVLVAGDGSVTHWVSENKDIRC